MPRKLFITWIFLIFSAAGPAAAEPLKFSLDKNRSTLTFDGTSPLHGFSGTTHELEGEIVVDVAENKFVKSTGIRVPIHSLKTGNEARDHAVQYTLGAAKNPDVFFEILSVTSTSSAPPGAGRSTYRVAGGLRVGDVTRPVEFNATAAMGKEAMEAEAEVPLTLGMFDLKPPRIARLLGLKNEVLVRFKTRWSAVEEK